MCVSASINKSKRRFIAWIAAYLVGAFSAHAQLASYDVASNVLTLDSVGVGSQYYTGVGLLFPPGQAWSVVGSPRLTSPLSASDAAVYANNQLRVPRAQIGNITYDNFVLSLPPGMPMSVAQMGVVSSASSPGYVDVVFPIRSKIKNSTETDSGGELTYALTNGQVWKHLVDEPCMPGGIGTSDPDGYSDVEIYPNPGGSGSAAANEGNFRFVTYYPTKTEALLVETCIVAPVSGVFATNPGSSLNALSASPQTLSGLVGTLHNVLISGGTPPYTVITSVPGVVDFRFTDEQNLIVKISRSGTAMLTIIDYNRSVATVEITEDAIPAMTLSPSALVGNVGETVNFNIMGGQAPYVITPANPSYVLPLPNVLATTGTISAKLLSSGGADSVTTQVTVVDARGTSQVVSITINLGNNQALATTSIALQGAAGQVLEFFITGGQAPYTVLAENTSILSVAQIGAQAAGTLVEATLNHIGNSQITVIDQQRSQVVIPVTVTAGEYFYPPSITGFAEGTQMDVDVLFGKPPYTITNPLYPHIQVTPVGDANTTKRFRLYLASVPPNTGDLNVGFRVTAANGVSAEFSISGFKPNPIYTKSLTVNNGQGLTFTTGDEFNLSIDGGRPPYLARNPNSNVFGEVAAQQDEWGVWYLRVKVRDDYFKCNSNNAVLNYQLSVRDADFNVASITAGYQSIACGFN